MPCDFLVGMVKPFGGPREFGFCGADSRLGPGKRLFKVYTD